MKGVIVGRCLVRVLAIVGASVLAALLLTAVPHPAQAVVGNGDIPGTDLTSSPATGTLDEATDTDDVYAITLQAGQSLAIRFTADAGTDFDVYLFPPSAASILGDVDPVAQGATESYPETLYYTARSSGVHYIDLAAFSGSGAYTLSWSIPTAPYTPVHRFVNVGDGTPFYTASESERAWIVANQSNVYRWEGVAYWLDPLNPANTAPLYRFRNNYSGTHFYTASATERDFVQTLAWFTYEGIAWYVAPSTTPDMVPVYRIWQEPESWHFYTTSAFEWQGLIGIPGAGFRDEGVAYRADIAGNAAFYSPATVHRFYNPSQGVHFYTASDEEAEQVIENLWWLLEYEGAAYEVNESSPNATSNLYRFYLPSRGVHFYTASEAERDDIIRRLGWMYVYEGPAYLVSLDPADIPVYRFYIPSKGVHFYTADRGERDDVIRELQWLFVYEGVAFYIP